VQALGRARRFTHEKREKTGREWIERAAVADTPLAQDTASDRDDVERGPALGFIDREEAGKRGLFQAIPSATG
jgi:hypothetical protein